MLKTLAPLALLIATALGPVACQSDPRVEARSAELASLPGIKVTIGGADLGQDKVQAIAKYVESRATDTGAAMVRMKKDDQGVSSLEIELYAKALPAGDALAADLEATFPELAGASIATAPVQGGPQHELPVVAIEEGLSPEEAKAEILEQLQAEGVDGAVDVQVHDGPEGRRIEVKVEKQEIH
ncbi:MAG TPA: hypothetical protein VIK91_23935 [Nannocystis sp.]